MKFLTTALLFCGLVGFVNAESLTFRTGTVQQGGIISYDSTTQRLSGIDIVIGALDAVTAANPGVYDVFGPLNCAGPGTPPGRMCADFDFTSGTLSSAVVSSGGLVLTFNPGGSLTLNGDVQPPVPPGADALLIESGTFNQPLLPAFSLILSGSTAVLSLSGNGSDIKNSEMAAFFGLQNPFQFTLALTAQNVTPTPVGVVVFPPTSPASFTAAVTGTSITNTAIPEPTSVALFGTMLLAMGWLWLLGV